MGTLLALYGSGEYTEPMQKIDSMLHKKAKSRGGNGPILLVPTAAGMESDYQKWNDMGIEHFKRLGVEAIGLSAPTRKELEEKQAHDLLHEASLVCFSGGRPQYLQDQLLGTVFLTTLINRFHAGLPIIASSAGAMIMGNNFLANPYEIMDGESPPIWNKGIGLTHYVTLPHYNHVEGGVNVKELMTAVIENSPSHIRKYLIGIDEETAYVLEEGEQPQILGAGTVHNLSGEFSLGD